MACSTGISSSAKTFWHSLDACGSIFLDWVSILDAGAMSTAVGVLILCWAFCNAAIFSIPTTSACTEAACHTVTMTRALVFAYFRLTLLTGVIAKAITRTVKAMSMVAAVAMADSKLALFSLPVFVTFTRQVRLTYTVVTAVTGARPFHAILASPSVATFAMASDALTMEFAFFCAWGNFTGETRVPGSARTIAIVAFAISTAGSIGNFSRTLAIFAVGSGEFIKTQAGGILLLTDTIAMAHTRAQTLIARGPCPVRLASTDAVDAQPIPVAVCFAVLFVAALARPARLADAYSIVTPAVSTSTNAFAHRAVRSTPTFIANAHAIITSACIAIAIMGAESNAAVLTRISSVADTFSSSTESVHVTVLQMRTTFVAAVISTPWRLALAHTSTALTMPVALFGATRQLSAIFARKARLAKACSFVAVPIGTTVIGTSLDAAVDTTETPSAHTFPPRARSVHASLWAFVFHAIFSNVPWLASTGAIVATTVARAHGLLHRCGTLTNGAVFTTKAWLTHAFAFGTQTMPRAII